MQVHVARDGKQIGVFSLEEIKQQLAAGTLAMSDQAWYEGAAGWAPLSTVPGVSGAATTAAAPAAPVTTVPTAAILMPQNRTEPLAVVSLILSIAGLLGFCCGFLLFAAIAGIVCGHLALSRIKKDPTLQGTRPGHGRHHHWLCRFGGLACLGCPFRRARRPPRDQRKHDQALRWLSRKFGNCVDSFPAKPVINAP